MGKGPPAVACRKVQCRQDIALAQAADAQHRITRSLVRGAGVPPGQDHLERDDAVEPEVPGLVNHPHAAAAQLRLDLVARQVGESVPAFLPLKLLRRESTPRAGIPLWRQGRIRWNRRNR